MPVRISVLWTPTILVTTDMLHIVISDQNIQNGPTCLHLQVEEGKGRTYYGGHARKSYSESESVNLS